jgi:hypothetical protein
MSTLEQKQKRSEQARINGAKSKGPKTPEGLKRAQTASLNHGLYATTDTLRHTVDPQLFEEFRAEILAIWQPENYYIARRVNQLIAAMWESDRLQAARRKYMTDLFETESEILNLELLVSVKGSPMDRLDSRIRKLNLEISRTERDLLRLKKTEFIAGPSHNVLKTQPAIGGQTAQTAKTEATEPHSPADSSPAESTPSCSSPATADPRAAAPTESARVPPPVTPVPVQLSPDRQ